MTSYIFALQMKTSNSKYAQCLYFTSQALARKVEKLAIEVWQKVDLSPSHAYLLMAVLEEPGLQPGVLASHLQLQPSTITRLIEKLESKKLVVRTTEGKITNVYPTPKSKELQPRLKQCLAQFYQRYSQMLSKEESEKLVKDMAKIADKLIV
jgi:MarR family transcriptional regulator, organic hydroperoxide resistance regulator